MSRESNLRLMNCDHSPSSALVLHKTSDIPSLHRRDFHPFAPEILECLHVFFISIVLLFFHFSSMDLWRQSAVCRFGAIFRDATEGDAIFDRNSSYGSSGKLFLSTCCLDHGEIFTQQQQQFHTFCNNVVSHLLVGQNKLITEKSESFSLF